MKIGIEFGWKKLESFKIASVIVGEVHEDYDYPFPDKPKINTVYLVQVQIAKLCFSIFITRSE